MNGNLEYLADTLIIESLAKDDTIVVTAQEGIIASVASGVKNYVLSQWDPQHPAASVAAFMGSGLLWSMGFKWMSVLYTVADAIGFDWKSFWATVGNDISEFVETIIGSKEKVSENEASSKINNIVSNAFENNFKGNIDKSKLLDVARRQKFGEQLNEALEIKGIAIRLKSNPRIEKEAGALSIFKGKLARFFIKIIAWLVKTALISLGFVAAEGAATGLVDHFKNEPVSKPGVSSESGSPIYRLKVSPNVPREMFSVHPNNLSSVWIERGEIENIEGLLTNWILSIYPQLKDNVSDIQSSSGFISMVDSFRKRNRLANGLGMISVPRPYQRKSDVVSAIVNDYLESHPEVTDRQDETKSDSNYRFINNKP